MKMNRSFKKLTLLIASFTLAGCTINISDLIGGNSTFTPEIRVTDSKKSSYYIGDIFDNFVDNSGLNVSYYDEKQVETKLTKSEYNYTVKTESGFSLDPYSAFTNEGSFVVNVSYKQLDDVSYKITVSNIDVTSVSLNKHTLTLKAGESSTLTATVTPSNATSKTVSWFTSNSNIATVDNGKVTAKTVGETTITAKIGSIQDTCKVTVTGSTATVTSISASNYTSTCYVGDTYSFDGKVTATYSDGTTKDVTSSATFSSLSTSTAGEKTLTISYGTIKTTVKITVLSKTVAVTGVTLSATSKSLEVGDTFVLTPTVSPSNATNKTVTWSSGNTNVATVSNGVVTAKAVGNSTITVKTQDGNKTATCMITVLDSGEIETITPEEAVTIIKSLGGSGIVSSKEYYVRGIASNVETDTNGFNGGFLNSNLKFRSVKGNGLATVADDIEGKEVIIFGYLELYNDIYQLPYLPASASPTGVKYNPKLTYVEESQQEENIDATNISVSPVSKTLNVGEKAVISATILPSNTTNKTVTWSSSNSSICSVASNGEITANAVGSAVITAKTHNNLTATCDVVVQKQSVTPVSGDKYVITFDQYGVDGQTELNVGTLLDQVTSGSNYIDSVNEVTKVYKGISGLKFGSSRSGGSLTFTLTNSFSNLICKEIDVEPVVYGDKSTTVNIYADDEQITYGSSSDSKILGVLKTPKSVSKIKISTSSRAYISSVTVICEEVTPIPVTGISIPTSKSISTGNSETLTVTYTPSNANRGKTITWTSSAPAIASVSNGVVTGVAPGSAVITAKSEGGFTATCNVTVSNIAVTSVSLSSTSETMYVGGTKQLTETVLPANATNKQVTWKSSSTSVATVSSTGLISAVAAGSTTITVTTSDGGKTATCKVTVEAAKKDAWTILIYMCGADLESESGLATSDIKEILSVGSQPSDVNIVIETGGAKSWSLSSTYLSGATKIDASKLSRWHVENKKLVLDQTISPYTSMGESSTLQSFLEYGITEYPAEKTGVIFWNHGGAMYGCCYDEKKDDDSLTNSEMSKAFKNALANTKSSKLEFVGYDTCLTQVQDIAEFNSQYFNYMIASEESESGYGWDYDTWVDDLYAKKTTSTILTAIVDGFITDNGGASSSRSDQTLSWLDLSQMAAYKTAFESFASALSTQLSTKSVTKKTFASWMDSNVKAFCVDSDQDEAYYCLFDVKDMLNKISSNSTYNPGSTYISNLQSAFTNLVKYSVAQKGAGNAYGLGCIYCQANAYASYIKKAYTSTETNFTNWLSFCKTYSYLA